MQLSANATVSGTVSGESLNLLPNFSREASTLTIFQPGVGPDGEGAEMQHALEKRYFGRD